MNKITIIFPILILFLINPAFGFAGMSANNSTEQLDLGNATESDADIVLLQHLIEVDAVQFQADNKLFIRETLIFRNIGEKNFSGSIRTWVPDGAEGIRVGRVEMMMGAAPRGLEVRQNGNIISWQDFMKANDPLPPLYILEYSLPAEPKGTIAKAKQYQKVFLYPTLTKQPASIVLKVIKSKEESISVIDEKGISISASGNPKEEDGSVLYGWEMPEFKEFRVELSKPAFTLASIAGYVILGLVIVLALSYPIIRKKSARLQVLEEKIKNALKREEIVEEFVEVEEAEEAAAEEIPVEEAPISEEAPAEEFTEFEGKTKEELEALKAEALSKIDELKKDYEAGNLLDEEYEELRKPYGEKINKITRRLE